MDGIQRAMARAVEAIMRADKSALATGCAAAGLVFLHLNYYASPPRRRRLFLAAEAANRAAEAGAVHRVRALARARAREHTQAHTHTHTHTHNARALTCTQDMLAELGVAEGERVLIAARSVEATEVSAFCASLRAETQARRPS